MNLFEKCPDWVNKLTLVLLAVIVTMLIVIIYRI
jgi:hypothetical protein